MHIRGSWILLIFITLFAAVILLLLHLTKLGLLIHQKIPDRPHRRLFLASVSFFVTFLAVRLLVASITHHIGPFGYVEMGGGTSTTWCGASFCCFSPAMQSLQKWEPGAA